MDLFSTKSPLQFQQQVWDYEESIYESLKTEVYGLPKVQYDCRDLRPTFYAFFARVSNQLDWPNDGKDLQRISILERRRPLTGLDEYLNFANTCHVSGMPSEIHQQPSKINRNRGKRSAKMQSPLQSGDTKSPDHIYTEAMFETEYLLPKPMHAPSTHSVRCQLFLEDYHANRKTRLRCLSHNRDLAVMSLRRTSSASGS